MIRTHPPRLPAPAGLRGLDDEERQHEHDDESDQHERGGDPGDTERDPSRAAAHCAAGRSAGATGSILIAHTLYSGIPMSESVTSFVRRLTRASSKWSAIQTSPG